MATLQAIRHTNQSAADHLSTKEAANLLGLAVRTVQLMVDRGELEAWKTSGGHRRISRVSVELWRSSNRGAQAAALTSRSAVPQFTPGASPANAVKILLIEDSIHFQNLVNLLVRQRFPNADLRSAGDGISGLALVGKYQPDILIVDILLPGIDGATLVSSLRLHEQFRDLKVVVVTSLSPEQRAPYAFALHDLPVVYKPNLVAELPLALSHCLDTLGVSG